MSNDEEERVRLKSKKFKLPKSLEHITKAIEISRYILDLEEDWNQEDAKRIEPQIWKNSVNFLIRYSKYIHKNYQKAIETPEINPCRDNSIDLSWDTKNARMLINIKERENNIIASYSGYQRDSENKTNEIKNRTPIIGINKNLADWMKNLSNK